MGCTLENFFEVKQVKFTGRANEGVAAYVQSHVVLYNDVKALISYILQSEEVVQVV